MTTESVAAVVDDIQTRLDRMTIDALLGTSTEAVGGQQGAQVGDVAQAFRNVA